jgi:hypothetical protein
VIWAVWHLPTLWAHGDLADPLYLGLFVVELTGNSIIATSLFLGSRGGVLLPLLFHAAGNTAWAAAPIDYHADHRLYAISLAVRWVLALSCLALTESKPPAEAPPRSRGTVAPAGDGGA